MLLNEVNRNPGIVCLEISRQFWDALIGRKVTVKATGKQGTVVAAKINGIKLKLNEKLPGFSIKAVERPAFRR